MTMPDPTPWAAGEPARVDKLDALKRMMEWLADRTRSREDAGYDLRLSGGISSMIIATATNVTNAEAPLATCAWWPVGRLAQIEALAAATSADARLQTLFWMGRPPTGSTAHIIMASSDALELRMYANGALTTRRTAGVRTWFVVVLVTTV